jgi:hypothetical protein
MTLIDRYVLEVGRHLPRKNRGDIQVELRSSIYDALEDRYGGDPTEEQVADFLSSTGAPKKVAASYYPEGQYLIGPVLFPLFKLVVGIALVGVLGAQLLAWVVAAFIAQKPFSVLEALGGMFNSIPVTFGMVVIVFAVLQWFDVRPDLEDEPWDPQSLPELDQVEPVKRGERIFGIAASLLILMLLFFFPQYVGFMTAPGGEFFSNPVILDYLVWITISLGASIALDIYLLWQGRWTMLTRVVKIVVNLLGIAVLALLVQGHTAWLAERGAAGFFPSLDLLTSDSGRGFQILGMQAYRLAFGVALIVITIVTFLAIADRVRSQVRKRSYPGEIAA